MGPLQGNRERLSSVLDALELGFGGGGGGGDGEGWSKGESHEHTKITCKNDIKAESRIYDSQISQKLKFKINLHLLNTYHVLLY